MSLDAFAHRIGGALRTCVPVIVLPCPRLGHLLTVCLILLALLSQAYAADITLDWDPSPSPDVSGYRLHYGSVSGAYTANIDAGNQSTATVPNLTPGQIYYFATTAYDAQGQQSVFSNEVPYTIPLSAPVASFRAMPTSGTVPLTVTFTDTSTGTITARAWDFGDGTTSTVQHPSHTYTAAGSYSVRLTVTGPDGSHTLTETNYITVTTLLPAATFTATPTTGAAPLVVAFGDTSTGSISSWAWDFGDGSTSTAQHPSHPYATAGTYTVRLTVSGANGTDTLTRSNFITVVSSTGLVAAYGFENGSGLTVTDVSGAGNHGLIAGATWTPQGRFGQALTFDGINDWVTIAAAPSLNFTTGMTLEAWVYPGSQAGWRTIIQKQVDAYLLHASSDSTLCPAGGGTMHGVVQFTTASSALPVNTWSHLALTYDGTTIRLYTNGTLVSSLAASGPLEVNNNPVRLGGNSTYGEYFLGRIDEIRMYNRALTAAEIRTDMETPVIPPLAPPVANFSGTLTTGIAPLAVTFTNTTRGHAIRWRWDFGDGTTSTARHPSHTYSTAGVYTVTLTAIGPGGSHRKTRTSYITVIPSILEIGEVQVSHVWKTVPFRQPFSAPIVVAHAMSLNGTSPATVRLRNVTPTGFELHVEEWNYLDGLHTAETVAYLVVEQGRHTLNGVPIEAGRVQANWTNTFGTVTFTQPFAVAPVVLTAVASTAEATTVTTRVRSITTTSFQMRMQEQQLNVQSHAAETLTYIAIPPAVGTVGTLDFEVKKTARVMTHVFRTLSFASPFMNPPVFLAALQTNNDTNPAVVRWENKDFTGVDVQVQEELSKETDSTHLAEVIGYVAFASTDGTVDTDGDSLSNVDELTLYGTDPAVADTDHDGLPDGAEVAYWGANWNVDSDSDGLINLLDPDSDGDGILDGAE